MNIFPRFFNTALVSFILCVFCFSGIANSIAQESSAEPAASESVAVESAPESAATDSVVTESEAVAESEAATEESEAAPVESATAESAPVVDIPALGAAPDAQPDSGQADAAAPLVPAVTEEESATESTTESAQEVRTFNMQGFITLSVFVILIAVCYVLGNFIAKHSRLPEHGFKIFVVLLAFFGGFVALALGWNRLTLGIDLQGGVVLIYDVRPIQGTEADDPAVNTTGGNTTGGGTATGGLSNTGMEELARAISRRVNPGGVREIAITKLGQRQIQVVIPHAEAAEVARIERVISESGALTFRILASRDYPQDADMISRAERAGAESLRDVLDPAGKLIARWVPVFESEVERFRSDPSSSVQRERRVGNSTVLEVLVKYDDGVDITGEYLTSVGRGMGDDGQPGVSFNFDAIGTNKCARLTGSNLPDPVQTRLRRCMGIVLNDSLYSAPYIKQQIRSSGIITFGDTTSQATEEGLRKLNQDIDDLIEILQAGALPAELSKEPASRMQIGATLGNDTIQKAKYALSTAAVITIIFMIVYYRLAGCVAAFCVITNTVLIVAAMLAFRAAFTLPGLAGLVLTIGMAVDANILIYERMREELAGGASLKMAIRNGYAKAFSAIFDSNITTILVGCILFAVGTEQVKGFAVTLVLGISLNLFTAIFCARVLMEVLASQRWVKTFNMMQMFKRPNINFLQARWICASFSLILIIAGLIAVAGRGRGLLDIDFVGGVSVESVFKETQDISQIRSKLYAKDATIAEEENRLNDLSVQNVQMSVDDEGKEVTPNTHFIITSSIPQVQDKTPLPDAYLATARSILKETFGNELEYGSLEYLEKSTKRVDDYDETTVSVRRFPKTNHDALLSEVNAMIRKAAEDKLIESEFPPPVITREGYEPGDQRAFEDWTLTFNAPSESLEKVLSAWEAESDETPNFPTSTTVGGSVARNTRVQGAAAIFASLIAMTIYVSIRFSRWIYGLIAVLGLLHVVLIVLGLLALSRWCAIDALQITEFKIGLPVVAAFLTLIGYAINDTIILFDRIRENLGKSTILTGSMINLAVNQTLSRTVLTSLTTFLVAFILYVFGGQGIHTFAFAITAGVFFGTYSTIGICASLLFWSAAAANEPKK